jgi:hypothetical protein
VHPFDDLWSPVLLSEMLAENSSKRRAKWCGGGSSPSFMKMCLKRVLLHERRYDGSCTNCELVQGFVDKPPYTTWQTILWPKLSQFVQKIETSTLLFNRT